jgi:hypothetical protein
MQTEIAVYIFFSEQAFVAASHVPPAFSQSAAFLACVTSPANAGTVNPSASVKANVERSVFMAITPTQGYSGEEGTLADGTGSRVVPEFWNAFAAELRFCAAH